MDRVVEKILRLDNEIQIPPDKSITHRGIILAALAKGTTILTNPLICKDTLSTLHCVNQLGAEHDIRENSIKIISPGYEKLHKSQNILDAGNSGTTIRLLSGVLASLPFKSIITGDDSLKRRPMKRIIDPLKMMGAEIESENLQPPLQITGRELRPFDFDLSIPSAQVKSAIILAALNTIGLTKIREKTRTRDHTERMLKLFGSSISRYETTSGEVLNVLGKQKLYCTRINIPGDFSSAAYFIGLSLMIPGSRLVLKDINLNPTRTGMLKILKKQDVIKISDFRIISGEPRGTLIIRYKKLNSFKIRKEEIPAVIDEIPILCVIATQIEGTSIIQGATELKYKESNRLSAIQENIKQMGGDIEVDKNDDIIIRGATKLKGSEINPNKDHRICMAFTIAGMIADGKTTIKDVACVDYSFPGFFDIIDSLG